MEIITDPAETKNLVLELLKKVEEETGVTRRNASVSQKFHAEVNIDEHYKIVVYERDDQGFLQIRLDSSGGRFLVEFGFGAGRFACFAANQNGEVVLLRSERNLSIGPRSEFEQIEIGDRFFYVVCSLQGPVTSEIVRFYEDGLGNRKIGVDFGDVTTDLGAEEEHARSGCIVIPKHHPVAMKAKQWLLDSGYSLRRAKGCRPDFYVEKAGKLSVVEVKPDLKQQSIAAAIGQVLLYRAITGSHEMLIILPNDEGADRARKAIGSVDKNISVELVSR